MSASWHENPMLLLEYRLNNTLSAANPVISVYGTNWRAKIEWQTPTINILTVDRDGLPAIQLRVRSTKKDRARLNSDTLNHVRALINWEAENER